MSLKLLTALAVSLLCLGTTVAAQERPLLTGTWMPEKGPQAVDAPTLKIIDNGPLLTIESTSGGQTETVTFTYVGEAEAVKRFEAKDEDSATRVETTAAHWHDGQLTTYIERQISGKTVTQNIRYTPDSSGRRMIVERSLQVHHGYGGASGQVVYVKQ